MFLKLRQGSPCRGRTAPLIVSRRQRAATVRGEAARLSTRSYPVATGEQRRIPAGLPESPTARTLLQSPHGLGSNRARRVFNGAGHAGGLPLGRYGDAMCNLSHAPSAHRIYIMWAIASTASVTLRPLRRRPTGCAGRWPHARGTREHAGTGSPNARPRTASA